MTWDQRLGLSKMPYTVLLADDGRELARYWHRAEGFVPETRNNNAGVRPDEASAREYVLRSVLDRYKREMAEIGTLLHEAQCSTRNVPRGNLTGLTR